MNRFIKHCLDLCQGKAPLGVLRSPGWSSFRKEYIEDECQACRRKWSLELHHIEPYHLAPERELDPSNVMTLCRRCHLLIGHLNYWRSYNPRVIFFARRLRSQILDRP